MLYKIIPELYNPHLVELLYEFEPIKLLIRGDMIIPKELILKEKKTKDF